MAKPTYARGWTKGGTAQRRGLVYTGGVIAEVWTRPLPAGSGLMRAVRQKGKGWSVFVPGTPEWPKAVTKGRGKEIAFGFANGLWDVMDKPRMKEAAAARQEKKRRAVVAKQRKREKAKPALKGGYTVETCTKTRKTYDTAAQARAAAKKSRGVTRIRNPAGEYEKKNNGKR